MKQILTRGSLAMLLAGAVLGVVFSAGFLVGRGLVQFDKQAHAALAVETVGVSTNRTLTPEMVLRADAACGGDKIGVATGPVADGQEGLFALDYATGDLFCWVLNPRFGPGFQAQYMTNVQEHLGVKKGEPADYVITTGRIDNSGVPVRPNALKPADCVCYVADGNTGRVAGFSFTWSKNRQNQGGMQEGELLKVCEGLTRGNIQRD